MKVGDEYVSYYYHPLSFVNMTITTTITITGITLIILILKIILKPWLFIQPFSGIVRLKVTSRSDVKRCRLISWKKFFTNYENDYENMMMKKLIMMMR